MHNAGVPSAQYYDECNDGDYVEHKSFEIPTDRRGRLGWCSSGRGALDRLINGAFLALSGEPTSIVQQIGIMTCRIEQ